MTKYVFKCDTGPDFYIESDIEVEDWNLIRCKCKKAGIACKLTHIVDDDMKGEAEEIWIIEPRAVNSYSKMLTALILA